MPQIHFYVPESTALEIKRRAEARHQSTSRYLAELVKRHVEPGWPDGFADQVLGGWSGAPLTRPPQGEPETREDL